MESCYYEPIPADEAAGRPAIAPDGTPYEYFQPTEATLSVWAPTMQHGGPPTGLSVRSLQRCEPDSAMRFTRVTTEILGVVGLGVNRVSARVTRPGRQISLVSAELEVAQPDGSFRSALRSVAWRLHTGDSTAIEDPRVPPLSPTPDQLSPTTGIVDAQDAGIDWGTVGFIGTLETARVPGRTGDTAARWLRPAIPLVEGEKTSDMEAFFTVVDVANGLGTRLHPEQWSWMNTDTTVHLIRDPVGGWAGVDSAMGVGPNGYGATFGDLYDVTGFVGRSAQTVLLVAR